MLHAPMGRCPSPQSYRMRSQGSDKTEVGAKIQLTILQIIPLPRSEAMSDLVGHFLGCSWDTASIVLADIGGCGGVGWDDNDKPFSMRDG
jgi:hypothetical protein